MSDEFFMTLAKEVLCARIASKHTFIIRTENDMGKILVELAMAIKHEYEARRAGS